MSGVLILSHPKSGRTWLRYMLSLAGVSVTSSHAGASTHDRTKKYRNAARANKIIQGKRAIFLYRDPIDTAVSFYFQMHKKRRNDYLLNVKRLLRGQMPSRDIREFVRSRQYGVPRICKFNRFWYDFLSGNDMSSRVRYEDLSQDSERALSLLLEFLNVADADLDRIIEDSSFQVMKNMENVKFSDGGEVELKEHIKGDGESRLVRKGKIRGYIDYLDEETINYCRNVCEAYGFSDY